MSDGHAVVVITKRMGGGDPAETMYYVAVADQQAAVEMVRDMANPTTDEKVRPLHGIPESSLTALGIKPGECIRWYTKM